MALKIMKEFDEIEKSWIVDVNGDLDIVSSTQFKKLLTEMLEEIESNIKLNCENLFYIDSTGLGAIINILNRVKKNNNNISIINAQENIDKMIRITGLDKVITIEEMS